jgi:hypothetical protein
MSYTFAEENLLFDDIVTQSIIALICDKLEIDHEVLIMTVQYLPTYKLDLRGKKTLSKLYIRLGTMNNLKVVTAAEISLTGASWEEVLDFLDISCCLQLNSIEFFNNI